MFFGPARATKPHCCHGVFFGPSEDHACKSGRIATTIKDKNNSVLYMYIGGGAVDHELLPRGVFWPCEGHQTL